MLLLWVGNQEPTLWLFNTLVASFVILILYDQIRPWVEETTAKLILQHRHQLRQIVQKLSRDLRTTIGIEDMCNLAVRRLGESGRFSHVAVYLPGEGEVQYELRAWHGDSPPQVLGLRQQPTLLQELRRARRPVLLETLIERYDDHPALTDGDPTVRRKLDKTTEAIATMRALGADVVLPMLDENEIMGILSLGTDPGSESLSTEEIASVLSVTDACAVVIEKSQEYRKIAGTRSTRGGWRNGGWHGPRNPQSPGGHQRCRAMSRSRIVAG